MLEKILYTESGSDNTQAMLKFLMDIPAIKNANLNLLHIVKAQSTQYAEEQKRAEGKTLIANLIKEIGLDENSASTIMQQGDPKDIVLSVAKEVDADLIIMGSRALGRIEAILSNSTSQYVFQLSDRNLLLVNDNVYVKKIRRVMVAMDKSAAAEYALDLAISLLRDYKEAVLYLARVNPNLTGELTKSEMEKDPVLAGAVAKAKKMGIDYRCVVTGGKAGPEICNLADENNIDLLMLGSADRRPSFAKGFPDMDRLIGSSLSDYVRVNTPCPVILARPSAA